MIERIYPSDLPAPAGHYAPGAAWRDLLFVSGQLPVGADGTHTADRPFAEQAAQVLANLLAVLRAGGSGPESVLKVTAYIVAVEHWPAFDRAFAEAFGDWRPARAIVPVPELHHGYLVEVEGIAVRAIGEPADLG